MHCCSSCCAPQWGGWPKKRIYISSVVSQDFIVPFFAFTCVAINDRFTQRENPRYPPSLTRTWSDRYSSTVHSTGDSTSQPKTRQQEYQTRSDLIQDIMASSTPRPGICYVTARPRPQLPDSQFNDFYNTEHIPDMLRYDFAPLALRYKNADPASPLAYLALYPQDDAARIASPETAKMMEECRYSRVLGGQDHHELIEYGVSAWTHVQTFEGPGAEALTGNERGETLVAVTVAPGAGAGAEEDLEAWYREEHLGMLSRCRGYRRSTRYRREGGEGSQEPKFLALHEYACTADELPAEQIKETRETEWAKRILGSARGFEREVWSLLGAWGKVGRKL